MTRASGAAVDGAITEHATLTPFSSQSFDATFPSGTCQTIVLEPGVTASAPPGRYCRIQVKAGATLNLRSGNYYVDALDPVEPEARLVLDDVAGPVRIFVKNAFAFRGAVVGSSSVPDVLFGVIGGGAVAIESAFSGTILAPGATLNLSASGKTIKGAFFAQDIIVQPDMVIEQRSVTDLRKCDDSNACTRWDFLENGVCVGQDPVLFGVPESDSGAPLCLNGKRRVGCRGFDCVTGLPTGTWLSPPTCDALACNASCPPTGCTPQNRLDGNVVECACTCTDPAGGPPLTLPVQVCEAQGSSSCAAACARAPGVCDPGLGCEVGSCTPVLGAQPTVLMAKSCRLNDQGVTSTTAPFSANLDPSLSRVEINVGGRFVSGTVTGSLGFSIRSNPDGERFGLSSFSGRITGPIDLFGRRIDLVEVTARRAISGVLTEGSQAEPFSLSLGPNDLAARAVIAGVPQFVSLDATGMVNGTLSVDRRTVTLTTELRRINGDRITLNLLARTVNFPPRPTISIAPGANLECSGQRSAPVNLAATATDPNQSDVVSRFQWTRRDPAAIDQQLTALGAGASIQAALPMGASEISVIAYDNHGAAGRAQVVVTVRDTLTPVVTAPPDRTVYAGAEASSAVVNLGSATGSDACDPALQVQALLGSAVLDSGAAVLPVGTWTVTWRTMDAGGNVGAASQQVTVLAEDPPIGFEEPPLVSAEEGCAAPFTPPGSPELQVDVPVCVVGRINAGVREGAEPFESCPDDACTDQRIRDMLAGANPFFSGFVRFNSVGFKRIRDPAPPGQGEECTTTNYGDVCFVNTLAGSGGREADKMRDECLASWGFPQRNAGDTCTRSVVLVLVRASRTNGICGVALAAHTANATNCADPTTVPDNTSGAFAMAHTNLFGIAATCDPVVTVAHELGHALGLEHGDGLDNNCNGVWDEKCDRPVGSPEIDDGPATLMHPFGSNAPLTALQTDRARGFASKSVPTFGTAGRNCVAPPIPIQPGDSGAPLPPPRVGCGCEVAAPPTDVAFAGLALLVAMFALTKRKGKNY